MRELKIEYIPIEDLKTYAGNAKIHTAEQVEQIKKSIQEFGMNDPIAVWKDNEIIEGHGRLIACTELGIDTVPIIRLDDLTDEQRKAYALVHNKLTMNTDFDLDQLAEELEGIEGVDMEGFGFIMSFDDEEFEDVPDVSRYSKNAKIPQYEPTGEHVDLTDCVDMMKTDDLINEIVIACQEDKISVEEMNFLIEGAHRHSVFNYANVAEYYSNASPAMQRLMEKQALVIIDFDDAVANGYVKLSKTLEDLLKEDGDD